MGPAQAGSTVLATPVPPFRATSFPSTGADIAESCDFLSLLLPWPRDQDHCFPSLLAPRCSKKDWNFLTPRSILSSSTSTPRVGHLRRDCPFRCPGDRLAPPVSAAQRFDSPLNPDAHQPVLPGVATAQNIETPVLQSNLFPVRPRRRLLRPSATFFPPPFPPPFFKVRFDLVFSSPSGDSFSKDDTTFNPPLGRPSSSNLAGSSRESSPRPW